MSADLKIFGESYELHSKRAGKALDELRDAEIEDREKFPHDRRCSSSRLLIATADIELEAAIKTNPRTSPQEKESMLITLARIQELEAQSRLKNKRRK